MQSDNRYSTYLLGFVLLLGYLNARHSLQLAKQLAHC